MTGKEKIEFMLRPLVVVKIETTQGPSYWTGEGWADDITHARHLTVLRAERLCVLIKKYHGLEVTWEAVGQKQIEK